ncbi:type I-E CRISPR-associated protein Cas7/Cse4/CasC [Streptomyces sp. NBC_00582]|uniref:type I-E CRISPR-associated protein Cas7/Cse4/CasC n=1 Tax=Streptomyces sp. NBC_00582 TaxID=2975783 RepID=UPI002E80A0D9|nr:type I-E CRISPR-associated protein Cas7/Cse4/CasC [Streptomyces sp. NBC_00582]WUB68424.1 type I-E CRISPR-associated protein Cas7/Cse4/CasC [Streptomyces sp. NBC_00582]
MTVTATDLSLPESAYPPIDLSALPGPFVVVHSLTTLVDVCLNRDIMGLPKSTTLGGVERMRVSAQSLTRAARSFARNHSQTGVHGINTRLLPGKTAEYLRERSIDGADALPAAALIVTAAGPSIDLAHPDRTLTSIYVSSSAPADLAELLLDHWDELEDARLAMEKAIAAAASATAEPGRKRGRTAGKATSRGQADTVPAEIKSVAQQALAPGLAADIALFGRMLPELPGGNVRSAAMMAHAFTVDAKQLVTDDFVTGDEWGSGGVFSNLGEQYLNSGTLYRYAALDRRQLRANLAAAGADAETVERTAQQTERDWTTAVAYALPEARRTRTGSWAPPTLVVAATTAAPYTAAGAFETPIAPPAGIAAANRLTAFLTRLGLHAGTGRWLPPANEPAPQLPHGITWEDQRP